ncbi:hypothetical protein GT354_23075, partial [Streptomyces sp. SID3343]|nr:hypothetical protein [Streptomyces sp. SID3343]
MLDALEFAQLAGFVTYPGPDRAQFAHALVRDALYEDIPRPRRARWHAAAAETIERLHPSDVAALAYHFGRAESRSTAARAGRYARAAAEQA